MNIKKLAASALVAVTAGATLGAVAFGQISTYVTTSNGALTSPMIVVGDSVPGTDVIGAADLAAHVAGYATTPVTVAGGAKSFSSTAEAQEVATANTKIYLDDSLGKSGVRSTMTDADLPTLLATGSLTDKNSTTIKYDQFLFLTPSSTTNTRYTLQFERPSSSSSDDGIYSFGRFTTSPSQTNYMLNYRLNFRKGADATALTGKTLTIAGETYTVLSDSTSTATTPKLVTTKASASQSVLVSDGEVSITVGSTTYKVQVVGTSDANTVVVSINGVSASATKEQTTNINGVDVYVDDVFHFANNQESSGANLLIGAEKVIFQNNSKVKIGTNEDNVDGTFVVLGVSSSKFDTLDIYMGAPASSVTDNLMQGSTYTLPALSKLALHFPGISEDTTASSRNVLAIAPSGDNLLQATWIDDSGSQSTINWAYKETSAGSQFRLANSNGDNITVVENQPVAQDQYVVLDAGDFPHLMQLTSISSDSLSFTLQDAFSGDSTKYELASSDVGAKTIYIDGQAYNAVFDGNGNTTINFTWGDSASGTNKNANTGDAITIWPTLKGKNGERLALLGGYNVTLNATHGKEIQLPTGAVNITMYGGTSLYNMSLTAITDEDGEASACATSPCVYQHDLTPNGEVTTFILGKTSTGGLKYAVSTVGTNLTNSTFQINVVGSSSETNAITQPGLLLVEEKDDSSDRYSVLVTAATEASGSNNVAIPNTPIFTATEDSQTRGSDSTITDYVDLYGTFAVKTTSGQDSLTLYYPDEQVYAIVGAGDASGTVSVGGATGSTVNQAVVITSPIAKLANEVNTATLASDLILVGGPCANALVATLVSNGELTSTTNDLTCAGWTPTTGIIQEVSNAFGSGQKALVVAGTSAADTRSLAAMVMGGTLSYEV